MSVTKRVFYERSTGNPVFSYLGTTTNQGCEIYLKIYGQRLFSKKKYFSIHVTTSRFEHVNVVCRLRSMTPFRK